MSTFRSAVTDADGAVDSGYLAMFVLMLVVVGVVPVMCIGTFVSMYFDTAHKFDVQSLGIGVGAVCGGFATTVGAVGMFRMGDKPRAGVPAAAPKQQP